jgi:hypothetical protein
MLREIGNCEMRPARIHHVFPLPTRSLSSLWVACIPTLIYSLPKQFKGEGRVRTGLARFWKVNWETQFSLWKSRLTKMPPISTARWIFISAFAICFLIANSCAGWHCNFKGLSYLSGHNMRDRSKPRNNLFLPRNSFRSVPFRTSE